MILKPLFFVYMGLKVLFLSRDVSVVKNHKGLPFIKRGLISPDYSVDDFKAQCKAHKVSFTAAQYAIIG